MTFSNMRPLSFQKIAKFASYALIMCGAHSMAHAQWQQMPRQNMTFGAETAAASIDTTPPVISVSALSAENTSPEIAALSRGLLFKPELIFEYVLNNISYEHYYGSKKGARLTLLEGSGNDYDQCALLIALLNEAAANTAGATWTSSYQKGNQIVPYGDGTGNDFVSWVGTPASPLPGLTWAQAWASIGYNSDPLSNDPVRNAWPVDAKVKFLLPCDFSLQRGWPNSTLVYDATTKALVLERIWVKLVRGSTTYLLDPSFKRSIRATPFASLGTAMGYNRTTFLTGAAATAPNAYTVSGISESGIATKLSGYTTSLASAIKASAAPHQSVDDFVGRQKIVAVEIGATLPTETPLATVGTPTNLTSIPDSSRVKLTIELGLNKSYHVSTTIPVSDLAGQRLSLTFSGTTVKLWQEDTVLLTATTTDAAVRVDTTFIYPNNYVSDTTTTNTTGYLYTRNDAYAYAIVYGCDPNGLQLRQRQRILDGYLRSAKALAGVTYDTAGNLNLSSISDATLKRQCITETLNVMGLSWLYHTRLSDRLVGDQFRVDMMEHHRLGRVAQEAAYYIDAYQQFAGYYSLAGSQNDTNQAFQLTSFFDSAHEHGLIEQMQPSTAGAASTVKMLSLANASTDANTNKIYRADSSSWATVRPLLVGYPTAFLNSVSTAITSGATYLFPKNVNYSLGTSWTGYGYAKLTTTLAVMAINSGLPTNGGYNSEAGIVTSQTGTNAQSAPTASLTGGDPTQPVSNSPTFSIFDFFAADPVDMATGAFVQENEDLSAGETEPRGLHLVRQYNSNSSNFDPTGLGWGWTHSYNVTASPRSAPDVGINGGTPYDVAAYLAAVYAAIDIFKSESTARQLALTAFIANWGVNNLKNNAVAITIGKESMQFIKQPDGSYQPPAMSTLTLTKNVSSGDYSLKERFGRTFVFSAGKSLHCTSITDFDGKAMTFTYDATNNNRLTKVTDASGRFLSFSYTGTRLSSVICSSQTDRSVTYLAADGNGNLTGYKDPEAKTWSYVYLNRLLTETKNPDSETIIKNEYDSQNRVYIQYNQGIAARLWSFFWSGVRNVEQSPLGQKTTYFYDSRGRGLGVMDGVGNRSRLAYDGQDHVVQSITPKGEVTTNTYDANHNLTTIIDPLGATTTNTYDSSQRLTQVDQVDSDGTVPTRTTKFVFNAGNTTNRPDSTIDPRGVTTKYTYQPSSNAAAGKIATSTLVSSDGNRVTTYSYSAFGLLSKIETPNPAGGTFAEQYDFGSIGDLKSFTDKRGNVFSYLYNNRRQKTQDTGPADGSDYGATVTKYIYSNSGDLQYQVDPLGKAIKKTWSPTGKLTSVQAGLLETAANTYDTAQAITTVSHYYDDRDWLDHSVGPVADQTTNYSYYDSGHMATVTNPESYTVTTSYDANGNQASVIDQPDGTTTRLVGQSYNSRGQLDTTTDALGKQTLTTYNAWGNRLTLKNRLNNTYTFDYEANGLLKTQTTPLNHTTTWAYNDRNLLKTLTKPSGQQTTTHYDSADRVDYFTDDIGQVSFEMDANGNRTTVTEGTKTIVRTYDPYNRLKTYTDSRGQVVEYHYFANGLLKSIAYPYPTARTVNYSYDYLNRPFQVSDWVGNTTTFTWRDDGMLSKITRPNNSTRNLTYDKAGRLTRIEERDSVGNLQTLLNYELDSSGRITGKAEIPLPETPPSALAAMTYDEDNRLKTFAGTSCTFDADGNLTNGPLGNAADSATGFGDYTFDQRNRLTASPGQSRSYDAENNLISRTDSTGTTYHVYDGGSTPQMLVRELPNGTKYYYVYGAGQLLYEISEGGPAPTGIIFYHYDHNGNTIALSNNGGQIIQRNEYSPYGQLIRTTANYDTPFLFVGAFGVQTTGDGLLYMRARFYNPRMGRFLNADPIGFGGGSNWYGYCGNNPIILRDPTGLWFGIDDAIATGVGALVGLAGQGIGDLIHGKVSSWQSYAAAAVGGAAGGEATLYGGPIAGGLAAGAATNATRQGLNWLTGQQTGFNKTSLVTETALGGAGGFVGAVAVGTVARMLPNSVKRDIGEGLSYIYNRLQGATMVRSQAQKALGTGTTADWIFEKEGMQYIVESKFGTSPLSDLQLEAQEILGDALYKVEIWGYDWVARAGGNAGFGAARAASGK